MLILKPNASPSLTLLWKIMAEEDEIDISINNSIKPMFIISTSILNSLNYLISDVRIIFT